MALDRRRTLFDFIERLQEGVVVYLPFSWLKPDEGESGEDGDSPSSARSRRTRDMRERQIRIRTLGFSEHS